MFTIEDLEPQAGDLMEELTDQEAATVSGGIVIGHKQPGTLVAIQPQPLPPGSLSGIVIGSNPGILVALNPQPLPPKESFSWT
jgi:hypothetical protein